MSVVLLIGGYYTVFLIEGYYIVNSLPGLVGQGARNESLSAMVLLLYYEGDTIVAGRILHSRSPLEVVTI
jgi:hypothetical protein